MTVRIWQASLFTLFVLLSATEGLQIKLAEIMNLKDYDGTLRPGVLNSPTVINVSLVVHALMVDHSHQVLELSGELLQEWDDSNLDFANARVGQISSIGLPGTSGVAIKEQIWRPDLSADQTVRPPTHSSLQEFLRINNDGHVIWTQRVNYAIPCPLDMSNYPLGEHICKLKLHSMGYDAKELSPQWFGEKPVDHDHTLVSYGYKLKSVDTTYKNVVKIQRFSGLGSNRQLVAEFKIETKGGWTVKHTVIPMIATVTCAYLSFFINVKGVCARMILCMMALMTAAVFHESTYRGVPQASYTMALEVFTGTCLTFIFVAAVESVVVDVLAHNYSKGRKHTSTTRASFDLEMVNRSDLQLSENRKPDLTDEHSGSRTQTAAIWLDRCFRVLYPVAFLAFNAVYWVLYN